MKKPIVRTADLPALIEHLRAFPDLRTPNKEDAEPLAERITSTVARICRSIDYYAGHNIHHFYGVNGTKGLRNCVALLTWLLDDPCFDGLQLGEFELYEVYAALPEVLMHNEKFVISDWLSERFAEEFVRTTLDLLHILPAGETPEQAADKLVDLNLRPALRVEAKSSERDLEIRRALASKAAREAADKFTRE